MLRYAILGAAIFAPFDAAAICRCHVTAPPLLSLSLIFATISLMPCRRHAYFRAAASTLMLAAYFDTPPYDYFFFSLSDAADCCRHARSIAAGRIRLKRGTARCCCCYFLSRLMRELMALLQRCCLLLRATTDSIITRKRARMK